MIWNRWSTSFSSKNRNKMSVASHSAVYVHVLWLYDTIQGNNRIENLKTTCDREMTGQNHKVQVTAALRISPLPVHKFEDWHNNQRYASSNITGWVRISHVWLHCPYKGIIIPRVCTQKISPASRQTNASSAFHLCIMKDSLVSCDLSGDAFRAHSHQQGCFFSLYNNVVQHHLHKQLQSD